jgi:hypothetical protein
MRIGNEIFAYIRAIRGFWTNVLVPNLWYDSSDQDSLKGER